MEYQSAGTRLFYLSLEPSSASSALQEEPLVLLHPTPTDHHFWMPIAERLRLTHRVLLPDLRGHGASDAGLDAAELLITVEQIARDLLAMLDDADVARAHFAGCSIGSYTLYHLWKLAPERVRSLVFCCGKPHADSEQAQAKRQETIATVREQGTTPFFENMLQALVGSTARREQPQILPQLRHMMETMGREAVMAVQRGLAERPEMRSVAAGITVPCLVIAAEEDPVSTPAEMEELAALLPRCEYQLVKKAGHYVPFEQQELCTALLKDFYAGLGMKRVAGVPV